MTNEFEHMVEMIDHQTEMAESMDDRQFTLFGDGWVNVQIIKEMMRKNYKVCFSLRPQTPYEEAKKLERLVVVTISLPSKDSEAASVDGSE